MDPKINQATEPTTCPHGNPTTVTKYGIPLCDECKDEHRQMDEHMKALGVPESFLRGESVSISSSEAQKELLESAIKESIRKIGKRHNLPTDLKVKFK